MIAQAIDAILKAHCSPADVRAVEDGGSPVPLWDALAGAGFLELLATEADGGAALSLAELFPILTCFGQHTVPVPAAQSIVARALVGRQLKLPAGMITLAPALRRDSGGALTCELTPHGQSSDFVLANDGGALLLLPCATARRQGTGVQRSFTATLTWPDARNAVRAPDGGAALPAFAAALHAALLSGAMNRAFDMTLLHCNARVQFGRSLGSFQAVQHQLSVMAEHTAAASIAAQAAFNGTGSTPSLLASAVAKARTSEAAALVASTAHALHGAIGITQAYDLQLLTRCMHEWRMAHGSENHWNALVGQHVLGGKDTLCDFVRTL